MSGKHELKAESFMFAAFASLTALVLGVAAAVEPVAAIAAAAVLASAALVALLFVAITAWEDARASSVRTGYRRSDSYTYID